MVEEREAHLAANSRTAPVLTEPLAIQWSTIVAGAFATYALAFVLHSFAAAIGISLSSTAPTWRDASTALILIGGLYLVLVALVSYGFGAFLAARLSAPASGASNDIELRDGMRGLIVWALATLLSGLIALATVQSVSRFSAPTASGSGINSVGGENLIAYDLDRLFRSDRRPQGPEGNVDYLRSQAARILFTASGHRGMQQDDRNFLVALVSSTTGLAPADATRRVDDVISRSSENISRARHASVILGFMVGAAALLGAIAAWYAASVGGRARDGRVELHHLWDWREPSARS